jgi:hypothetical protein
MRSVLIFRGILPVFTFILGCACSHAQGIQYDKAEFITQAVGPNVYVLTGSPETDPGHPEGAGGAIHDRRNFDQWNSTRERWHDHLRFGTKGDSLICAILFLSTSVASPSSG